MDNIINKIHRIVVNHYNESVDYTLRKFVLKAIRKDISGSHKIMEIVKVITFKNYF